jgi:hypothetical protein
VSRLAGFFMECKMETEDIKKIVNKFVKIPGLDNNILIREIETNLEIYNLKPTTEPIESFIVGITAASFIAGYNLSKKGMQI